MDPMLRSPAQPAAAVDAGGLAVARRPVARGAALCTALALLATPGCVTVGDHRREMKELEERVLRETRNRQGSTDLADLTLQIDDLEAQVRTLQGRVEVAEKQASDALAEARRARQELASRSVAQGAPAPEATPEGGEDEAQDGAVSEELAAYREAYGSWREDEHAVCIDRFRAFLRSYPESEYADDAAFWMADCHFKQGDYKNAVLRFDDVVRNYPSGNKAADALYRQGESLLRLGAGYHSAAKRAFERVVKEYPSSARAPEASRQLELLAAG